MRLARPHRAGATAVQRTGTTPCRPDHAAHDEFFRNLLDESGDYVSSIVTAVIPSIDKFSFSLPYDNLEGFLGRLLFVIKERHLNQPITLAGVGSGVQSFAIYSMLRLLHEIRPTNTHKKSKFIWLIEEPETFMHHDLQRKLRDRFREYASDGQIFISTHSPVFIDKETFRTTYVVTHDGSTRVNPITATNVREVIAGNLGVAFDDFFPFARYNILVEGDTDRTLLSELNQLFAARGEDGLLNLDEVAFLPCGGASAIPHFYNVYNVFSQYADFVAMFDRDPAGEKARADLLRSKIHPDDAISIPTSDFRQDCELEDLVDKNIWDDCLEKLDTDGLVTLKVQQGDIVDYEYLRKDRIDVKDRFRDYLIAHARNDLGPFAKYLDLLHTLEVQIAIKRLI